MKKRKEKMLWGKCPYCKEVFQFPFKDRVNVILFGHWKKYHRWLITPKQYGVLEYLAITGGMNAYMGEQGLVGGNLQNMMQRYQTSFMPEQQLLTAMNPSLSLQNILSGYNTAEANALTQLGMAGLEAEMGGLSSMSQLEAARVNALADSLQGLFGATAGAESPIDSLITSLLGSNGSTSLFGGTGDSINTLGY